MSPRAWFWCLALALPLDAAIGFGIWSAFDAAPPDFPFQIHSARSE